MCNASNTAGWATATTYLDVKGSHESYLHISLTKTNAVGGRVLLQQKQNDVVYQLLTIHALHYNHYNDND